MDTSRKENMPPWPGGHPKSGRRLVQKNVSVNPFVGNGRDTMMLSCPTESERTTPSFLLALGSGQRLELGRPSRQFSTLVQTNLPCPGQPLYDATSLMSNSCFEQQNNLHPRTWRPKTSEKWRGFSFQQSNMNLRRGDLERIGGTRAAQHLEEPEETLTCGSREFSWPPRSTSTSWFSKTISQTHDYPFPRDGSSTSYTSLRSTVQASSKGFDSPHQCGHQDCPVQLRPTPTLGCWAPDPKGRPLTLDDLALPLPNPCQQSERPFVLGFEAELSPESARLLLSMRRLEWQSVLLKLRASRDHPRPWPCSNWVPSQEASPNSPPGHPSPHIYSCRARSPEATPHLIPGHPNPLTLSGSTVIPRCHSPFTLCHGAVSPEASLNLTPRYPKSLTLFCNSLSPEGLSDLTRGYSNPHPCYSKAGSSEGPPNLISGYTNPHPYTNRTGSLEGPLNMTSGYPNHPYYSKAGKSECPSSMTSGYSSHHPYSNRTGSLEGPPNLTPGYPNTHSCYSKVGSPESTPNLTPRYPNPHPCYSNPGSPEGSPNLLLRYPNSHPCSNKAGSPEGTPNLAPGYPNPHPYSNKAGSPEGPPDLTPAYSNSHPYYSKTGSPEGPPNLTPGYPNPHPCSNKPGSPEGPPNLTPGYSNPHPCSNKPGSPEGTPNQAPGYPNPHPCSNKPGSPEGTQNRTPGYPNPHPCSNKVESPEGPPNLTPGYPNPHPCSNKPGSPEGTQNQTPGYANPHPCSNKVESPEGPPNLTPGYPNHHPCSNKPGSPEGSPNLTPGYPNHHSCSNKPGSPEGPPNLTPGYPNPHPCSNKVESPESSPNLTPGYPNPHPCSNKAGSPEGTPDLTPAYSNSHPCSNKSGNPEGPPNQTPVYPNTHSCSNKVGSPEGPPNTTPGYPNPHPCSNKAGSPECTPNLTSGYPNPHPCSNNVGSPEGPPNTTPGYPNPHPCSNKAGSPEGTPNLTAGYPNPHQCSNNVGNPEGPPNTTPGYPNPHLCSDKVGNPEGPPNLTPVYPNPHPRSNKVGNPEGPPNTTPDYPNPHPCANKIGNPEGPPNLTPDYPNPHPCSNKVGNPEGPPNLTPGYPNPHPRSNKVGNPEGHPNLTPGYPNPYPCSNKVGNPEGPPNLTPVYPNTHPCSNKVGNPEDSPNLTPVYPNTHPRSNKVGNPEGPPNLTPVYPSTHPRSNKVGNPEGPPNLTPVYPNTHPCSNKVGNPDGPPNLTPVYPSTHPRSNKVGNPEGPPNLTSEYLNSLSCSNKSGSPEAPQNLALGYPIPHLCSNKAGNSVISPDLKPECLISLPCSRAESPECPPSLTPDHSSPLTLSHGILSPVTSLDLTTGHSSPFTLSPSTVSPGTSPDLTPECPSPLTLSHSTVSPRMSPDLSPGLSSPLTLSHSTLSPAPPPDLSPGHSSPLTLSHSSSSPEALQNPTPGHPSPLSIPHGPVIPEASPSLTPGYPSSHTFSSKAKTPEASPNLTMGLPRPFCFSSSSGILETPLNQISGCPSPFIPSSSSGILETRLNQISGCPSPFIPSSSSGILETPLNQISGCPSPFIPSSSSGILETPLNQISRCPSPFIPSSSSGILETPLNQISGCPSPLIPSRSTRTPEVSPSLTPKYPSPFTLSIKSLFSQASPFQTPENLNLHNLSSQAGIPEVARGHSNPFTFTPGYPNSSSLSHRTLISESSPNLTSGYSSLPPLSHNAVIPEAPQNLTLGLPNPHILTSKITTPEVAPKVTPGYSSPHPSSSKTKIPEVSPNLRLGYPSPFTLSHSAVTPEVSPNLTLGYPGRHALFCKAATPEASTNLKLGYPSPFILSHRAVSPEVSFSSTPECSQDDQQFTRAFGLPKKQSPSTRQLSDFSFPSSGDGQGGTAPSFSSGTNGMNVFRTVSPASLTQPDAALFPVVILSSESPQAFSSKLSPPSGRGAGLGDPQKAVPASSGRSSLPMSACLPGFQGHSGQRLLETQLEEYLQPNSGIFMPLVPEDTNTPLPSRKKDTVPTHWANSKEKTSSISEGGARQGILKNANTGARPSGQGGRLGSGDSFSASSSIGERLLLQQRSKAALRSKEEGPWMDRVIAGNLRPKSRNWSIPHQAVRSSQMEVHVEEKSSKQPLPQEAKESRALLTHCFKAWRYHLLRQQTVARALRRRHLLQKGIRAMRWSLWLREAQMEFMKRKQGRTMLAKSFQKWKDLYLNRKERKLLIQPRPKIPVKDPMPSQKNQQDRSFVTLGVVCGVEGAPKIQLHPKWKSGSQDQSAPATQDLHRLAAFHLWYLRKALATQARQEAQTQAARAELGKRKLRRVFQAWWARTTSTARISPMVTRHQRAQLARCFRVWKHHIQRKTWCHGIVAHRRAETLRRSLQQWMKMVRLQATHSRAVTQLYLHRQKIWHLEVAVANAGPSRRRASKGQGEQDQLCHRPGVGAMDSLEEACKKLKLHRVVFLWSRRLAQHQQADSFLQGRERRLLQSTLQWWWQKTLAVEYAPATSWGSPQVSFLGSQGSEESSTSSGFLSSALVPLNSSTPRKSSERAHGQTDSSNNSFLSQAEDDPPWALPLSMRPPSLETPETWRVPFPLRQGGSQLREQQNFGPRKQLTRPPLGEENEFLRKAIQDPREPAHLDTFQEEVEWQRGSPKLLEAKHHYQITLQSRVIRSWNRWAATQGAWQILACQQAWVSQRRRTLSLWRLRLIQKQAGEQRHHQRVWRLAHEALQHWHISWQRQQTLQELCYQWTQHRTYILKRTVFGGWRQKASSMQKNTASWQEQLILQIHFEAWHGMVLTTLSPWVTIQILQAIQKRQELRTAFTDWQRCYFTAIQGQGRADGHLVWTFKGWLAALYHHLRTYQRLFWGHVIEVSREHRWAWDQRQECYWKLEVHGYQLCEGGHTFPIQRLSIWSLVELTRVADPWGQDRRTIVSQIYWSRQHCLLRTWSTGVLRHRLTKEEESTSVGPRPRMDAICSWRLFFRGHHILHADPNNAFVKQAGSAWTRTTALAQNEKKQHSHTGQRKLRKMLLSLGAPKCGCLLVSSPHRSAFQLWLQSHRRQSKAKALTSPGRPRKAIRGQEGGNSRAIQIPKRRVHWRTAVLEGKWLGKKYLQKWRHEVLLQKFHGQQKRRRLAEVWQCWMDARGAKQLARTLVRQRWLEWSWRIWRRRWQQVRVALHLQEDRSVLSQVAMSQTLDLQRPGCLEDGTSAGQPRCPEEEVPTSDQGGVAQCSLPSQPSGVEGRSGSLVIPSLRGGTALLLPPMGAGSMKAQETCLVIL